MASAAGVAGVRATLDLGSKSSKCVQCGEPDSARITGNPDTTSATSSRGKEAADDGAWVDEKAQEASGVSSGPRSSEISRSKHLEFGGRTAWIPARDRRIHRMVLLRAKGGLAS